MIVVAMPEELKLIDSVGDAVVTGVGALNVIRSIRNFPKDTPILNVGYAGSNSIPIGTRVSVGKVRLYHPKVDFQDSEYDIGSGALCYTSCDFVTDTNIEEPCVFDMELAFILALGFTNVSAIKVVSDNLSVRQFEEAVNENGV